MKIINQTMAIGELKILAKDFFGDMIKAVVDIERELIAVNAELHADLETFLLEQGSKQKDLWGINFYVDASGDNFIEYDSMINIRPSQNNRSRGVEDEKIRKKIVEIVQKRIKR